MTSHKLLSILLLVSLLATFIGTSQPAVHAASPLALVAVPMQSNDTIQRFQATSLPAYALLDDYILAGADSAGRSALLLAGLPFQLLDAELGFGYYLATRMPSAKTLDWHAYGRVLLDVGGQALLQTTSNQAEQLSLAGAELQYISLSPIVLPIDKPAEQVFPDDVTPDPVVQMVIDQVTQETVSQYDRELAGELPVWVDGEVYTITTRYTYSGEPIQKAAHYVGQRMAAQGLDVEYHVWNSDTNPNVIGEITGLTNPDDIYIIGGHLDAVPGSPGADDNGSGSVATMLAAELLSAYQWDCTVRFAFWTGEEQGLLGSAAYAARSYNLGENILGYINLDMIAWNTIDSSPNIDLVYHPSIPDTHQLAQLMSDVVYAYDLDLIPSLVGSSTPNSDHASFWNYDYTSILGIEDFSDFNPYYHTPQDTPAHTDLPYFTEFVKASIAAFMHMSGCIITDDLGYLDGTVTALDSGDPISYADIHIDDGAGHVFDIQTDELGYYTYTLLAGTYTVTASAPGYLPETAIGVEVITDTITTQDFSLETAPTEGLLEGQVTDASGGTPLPGVSITADPDSYQAITNSNGYYSMTLPGGDYLVTAELDGYLPQSQSATVQVGETTVLDFALEVEVLPAEIDITPSAVSVTLGVGASTSVPVTISNLGGSPLSYTITDPQSSSWLSFEPQSGEIEPANHQIVSLTLDTTGLATGIYTTTLEVASNDPSTPLALLPVTLTITQACVPVSILDLSWTPISPQPAEVVTFTASVTGSEPISFLWEFSDGITSTLRIYTRSLTPGIYTITLTTHNACGEDESHHDITIGPSPWWLYLPLVTKN